MSIRNLLPKKILRVALFCALATHAEGQPTGCKKDDHCSTGFYCNSHDRMCRECLRCEYLHREQSLKSIDCIKSMLDCGPCLKGLVVHDDEATICTSTTAKTSDFSTVYVWAIVVFVCLLLAVAFVYLVCNTRIFKVTSHSTVQSLSSPTASSALTSSTGDPPPPFFTYTLPSAPAINASNEPLDEVELKPRPANFLQDAREFDTTQSARVFNTPTYARIADPPPSYDLDHTPNANVSSQDPGLPDESPLSGESSVESSNAEHDSLVDGTIIQIQDTNNNQHTSDTSWSQQEPAAPCNSIITQTGTSFVINLVKNINNLQQRNDIAL